MTTFTIATRHLLQLRTPLVWLVAACVIAGCATPPPAPTAPTPVVVAPPPTAVAPLAVAPPPVLAPKPVQPSYVSEAGNPKDYRRDAAMHLYKKVADRIYQGKMPPLLHAVGVLQVDIDRNGEVTDVRWMRPPSHVPAVMAEIERTVRAAAPYPAPIRMERVTYTDTWLWHKTGRFQLDTLSEGQL